MNCLDVRRQISIDPEHLDDITRVHLGECQACLNYAQEQQGFNEKLRNSLDIEVPNGLQARILLRQSTNQRNLYKYMVKRISSIAASIFLFVAVGLSVYVLSPASLETTVLAHVNDELHHLKEFKKVDQNKLNNMLGTLDLVASKAPAQMTYAGTCNIRKHKGAHFVVKGKQGKVTVLLMPGEQVSKAKVVSDKRFNGMIYPTQYGSMAVIGEQGENLEQVRNEFQSVMKPGS